MGNDINTAELTLGECVYVNLINEDSFTGHYVEHDLAHDTFVIARGFVRSTGTYEDKKTLKISEIATIYYAHITEEEIYDADDEYEEWDSVEWDSEDDEDNCDEFRGMV